MKTNERRCVHMRPITRKQPMEWNVIYAPKLKDAI